MGRDPGDALLDASFVLVLIGAGLPTSSGRTATAGCTINSFSLAPARLVFADAVAVSLTGRSWAG